MSIPAENKNPEVKPTKGPSMAWPDFLSESIRDVIHNDFKFTTTTPVQVIQLHQFIVK